LTGAEVTSLRIGQILKPYGKDGSVEVESLTDFPDRYRPGSRLEVGSRWLTVAKLRHAGDALFVKFAEIEDRESAERLRGAYVTVPLNQARPLPDGRFYPFQLVGLTVVDRNLGKTLGKVTEVLPYDANDVLRVSDGSQEVLIPMVRSIVRSIEPAEGRIEVEMPDQTTT
jgi:16S rRNA processing protein RimM